ncbi:14842_t:CDS:2 [Acaulospora colombiana]|uniref:14842_t:CDS:1 n=1 Tax=Acaulospora colombiana TaxID=27376 RepID=A0ACA9P657_9GLOM|nr:14842_t:CDS:2 [Acaulospora colombiana]
MIIGIGTDIVSLARLGAFPIRRLTRLATRILTSDEILLLKKSLGAPTSLGADPTTTESQNAQFLHELRDEHRWDTHKKDKLAQYLGVRCATIESLFSPFSDNYCPNRWAAKEAIYKAMYPYRKLSWKDVELKPLQIKIDDRSGNATPKLEVVFTKSMNVTVHDSTLSFMRSHLSISHDAGLVVAMVVLEGQSGEFAFEKDPEVVSHQTCPFVQLPPLRDYLTMTAEQFAIEDLRSTILLA